MGRQQQQTKHPPNTSVTKVTTAPKRQATTTSGKWGAYNVANSFQATLYKQQF